MGDINLVDYNYQKILYLCRKARFITVIQI